MTSVCEQQYPRDNSIFSGREMFAAEMKSIFNNGWICVGTDDRLPVPNSRFVYEDFERSLLITRDHEGQVGAFVNACTHRGTRLCHDDGSGRQIQCPYHGWTFDFGGRLLGVPRRSGCETFDTGDFALKSVKSGLLGRFIFVHTGDEPAPELRDYVGSMADALEKVSAQLVTYLGEIRLPVKANWKLCVSGMVEDYHTPQVHPRTLNTSRGSASESILRERGHSYYEVKILPPKWVRMGVNLASGKRQTDSHFNYLLFPNLIPTEQLNVIAIYWFAPTGPDSTEAIVRLYDTSPARSLLNPLGWIQRIVWLVARSQTAKVLREDMDVVCEAQLGTMAGRDLVRGPVHVEEERVEHFLHEVAERLGNRY